ncbi:MAG: TerB family tellurite resistance protein [Hyphomicrobiales bacterium]|nr:TerB family tellurite resistance protein [Hyphomicrobiales bacterium]
MLGKLKSLFDEVLGANPRRDFGPDDYRVAAVALLIHLANADGVVTAQESARLRALCEQKFALDSGDARALIAEATERQREAVDLQGFTSVLKRTLGHGGRLAIVELLWDMTYADGAADELEENIVWRIAQALEVPESDLQTLHDFADRLSALKHTDEGGGA